MENEDVVMKVVGKDGVVNDVHEDELLKRMEQHLASELDCTLKSLKMVKVIMFKMPFSTTHFNLNQKVWVQYKSDALAAQVIGCHRGKNRYVSAWVRWGSAAKQAPVFKEIAVEARFAEKHKLRVNK